MKNRSYQVVKYGARLAIALTVLLAIILMAAVMGSIFGFDCLGSIIRFMVPILNVLLAVIPLLIVIAPGLLVVIGVFLFYRYRILATNQAPPKLQADAEAPLLAADNSADSIEAG